MNNEFVFIVPSYNNELYYKKNLTSIFNQNYKEWRLIYIDDASTDNTYKLVKNYINICGKNNLCKIIKNKKQMHQAYNRYIAYNMSSDNEIAIMLDGDDWLYDYNVLIKLNNIYNKNDLMMTYGSHKVLKNNKIINSRHLPLFNKNIVLENKFRYIKWSCPIHLRTFKINLLKKIPESFLKDHNGDWLKCCTDIAETVWCLENCNGKFKKIDEILYIYNCDNSLSNLHLKNKDVFYKQKYRNRIIKHIIEYNRNINYKNNNCIKKMLNINDIFIINLERRKDRLYKTKEKLKKENIIEDEYNVFNAVDGHLCKNKLIYNKYKLSQNNTVSDVNNRYLINSCGAMGLLLTYRILFKNILEEKKDKIDYSCLILEDDVCFHKKFGDLIKDYKYIFNSDYDIIYLGANQQRWDNSTLDKLKKQNYYEIQKKKYLWHYGTFSFIINKKSIKLIYDNLKDISKYKYPIDLLIWKIICDNSLKSIILYPNLLVADLSDSDNQSKRDNITMFKRLKWDINDYNIKLNLHINNKFVFIIPSYNCTEWLKKNLDSILIQKYKKWRIIYIDDNSSDDTYLNVQKYIKLNKIESKCTLLKNDERKYQAYSRYIGYNLCDDDEIAILLDGDDWLYNDNVLNILNKCYYKHNIEMTYGMFIYNFNGVNNKIGGEREYPKYVIKTNSYRKYGKFITQHLRTCKSYLLKSIHEDYLKDHNNEWLKCCTDVAEMWWCLERCGGYHMNIKELLCVYNKDNSIKYDNSFYAKNEKNQIYRKKVFYKLAQSTFNKYK